MRMDIPRVAARMVSAVSQFFQYHLTKSMITSPSLQCDLLVNLVDQNHAGVDAEGLLYLESHRHRDLVVAV